MNSVSIWLGIGPEHRLRVLRAIGVLGPEQYVDLAWNKVPTYIQEFFAEFVKTDDEIRKLL